MALTLKCTCGEVMKVGEEHAGKIGKCPHCGKPNKIPSLDEIQEFRKKSARITKEEVAEKKAEEAKTGESAPAASEKKEPETKAPESKTPETEPKKDSKKFKIPSKSSKLLKKEPAEVKTPSGRIKTPSGRLKTKSGRFVKDGDEGIAGRGKKPKRNPLIVLAIVGGIGVVVIVGAIFAFSKPDYEGAKDLYAKFVEIAKNQMVQPLYNTCQDFLDNGDKFTYSDFSKSAEDIKLAYGNFKHETGVKCPGAKTSSAYKILEKAQEIFMKNVWEERAKLIEQRKYQDNPAAMEELVRQIKSELVRVRDMATSAMDIMASHLKALDVQAGGGEEKKDDKKDESKKKE